MGFLLTRLVYFGVGFALAYCVADRVGIRPGTPQYYGVCIGSGVVFAVAGHIFASGRGTLSDVRERSKE